MSLLSMFGLGLAPFGLLIQSALPAHPQTSISFQDVTREAGIAYEGNTWGIAWGDGNGDGRPDFWSTNHGQPPTLYWNMGDGTFHLDTRNQLQGGDSHGAAWADFDRDGDEDLLEVTGAQRGHGQGRSHFYVNDGRLLQEQAKEFGLQATELRGRMPFWMDWNRDGEMDVLIACARRDDTASVVFLQREKQFTAAPEIFLGKEQSMFLQCTTLGGLNDTHLLVHGFSYPQLVYDLSSGKPVNVTQAIGLPVLQAVEDAGIGDFDGDGTMDLFLARATLGCEIRQVTEDAVFAKIVLNGETRGISFACPGPLQIAAHPIMNDWWTPPLVYIGREGKHPSEMPFLVTASEARGVWDDSLAEGKEKGVFVLADPDSGAWTIHLHGPRYEMATMEVRSEGIPIRKVLPLGFETDQHPPQDALLLHRGKEFVGSARTSGIIDTNSLGVAVADFDNDMDLDLYVITGTPLGNTPNVLYENTGKGVFQVVPDAGGAAGATEGVADAVAVADFDQDGFLDLLVSNGHDIGPMTQGPLKLYRNRGNSNHWLRLRLKGRANLEPIGAKVQLEAGGKKQLRTLGSQSHRGAQDERVIHFGLGSNSKATRIEIHWPSGAVTTLADIAADQVLDVRELRE